MKQMQSMQPMTTIVIDLNDAVHLHCPHAFCSETAGTGKPKSMACIKGLPNTKVSLDFVITSPLQLKLSILLKKKAPSHPVQMARQSHTR
jgi:hypothetical protein